MADNEKDIQNLINKYRQQQERSVRPGQFAGNPNQGIDSHTGIDNQGVVNESTPVPPGMFQAPAGHIPAPTGNICSQCDSVHPPLNPGEKCPNAKVKLMTGEKQDKQVDVGKFLVDLRNITVSQVEIRKIKDVDKLFKNIILEVTKLLENYEE